MAIDNSKLIVWLKAMSRNGAFPLEAFEVHDTYAAAEEYASSKMAYPGQTIKVLMEDGTYHSFVLQPSDAGYTLSEVGAIKEDDLKQYVKVVSTLPTTGQEAGILYIVPDTSTGDGSGNIWDGSKWVAVFPSVQTVKGMGNTLGGRIDEVVEALDDKAPIANPVFTGTVKIGTDEVAVKSYVDGLISNLESKTPAIMNQTVYKANNDGVKAGTTYRVAEAGTYFDHHCEVGDLIIVLNDWDLPFHPSGGAEGFKDSAMVIQANIDGAVTSTADTSTVGEIVVFDAVTGKIIKGSGVQIASLNDAIAKAHEHSNKAKLDTYDKTQAELLAAAKSEAQGLVDAHATSVNTALDGKADKATTLAGYGIADAYNKTEIDSKVKTVTDNLNTKITSAEASTLITDATPDILASAAEAVEERLGDIGNDTVKKYIDDVMAAGGTDNAEAIRAAKEEAIASSNTYTDTKIATAMQIVEF